MIHNTKIKTTQSVKMNLTYSMAYQILSIMIPLITAPYLSRVLGVSGIGVYSYNYSIAYYFALFSALGINNQGIRSVASCADNKKELSQVFADIYTLQLLISLIVTCSYALYVYVFVPDDKLIPWLMILLLISYLTDINWLFFGMEHFKITVTRNIIIKIITTVCIFIFIKEQSDVWLYTIIMCGGMLISQLVLWIYAPRFIEFRQPDLKNVIKNIKPVLVLFIPVLAFSIYRVMDKIMLGTIINTDAVGLFENAEKIINIPVCLITAFGTVMMPRMTLLAKGENKERYKYYLKNSFEIIIMLCCGMAFGLLSIADILAPVFFGEEFRYSGDLIRILAVCIPFVGIANVVRTQYLIPLRRDKIYVVSTFFGAVINLVLNLALIPLMQSKGTAISTVFAEISVMIVQYIYVRKEISFRQCLIYFGIYASIGAVMFAVVYIVKQYMGESILSLITCLIVGASLYLILSFLALLKTKNEVFHDLLLRTIKL